MDIPHSAKLNLLIGVASFLLVGGALAYEFLFDQLPPGYHLPGTVAWHKLLITILVFGTIALACYIVLFALLLFLSRSSSYQHSDNDEDLHRLNVR